MLLRHVGDDPGATDTLNVLDVGCGDGQLMELLQTERGARTRGLEVEQTSVNRCVANEDFARGGAVDTGNHVDEGRFAAARLADDSDELASPNRQVNAA